MTNLKKKKRLQKPKTLYYERAMEYCPQNELYRFLFFKQVRKTAEAEYAKNPLDADVHILLL